MAKSIMQKYTDTWNRECFLCREKAEREGYYGELQHENLDRHHIMYGTANRQLSEHYGLWVYLCKDHHQWGPDAVHFNQETDQHLRKKAQAAFEQKYDHEKWMQVFGMSYLEEGEEYEYTVREDWQ
ncbi:MAG: hypothetical protein LUH07_07450 [Lachnospiraceae bacterium]|nr:hypothetical protein [Lachnospiraceae bacterium]